MTPSSKDPRYILHNVPATASEHLKTFYDSYLRIKETADGGKWVGITSKNFIFEYNSYDGDAEIIFSYTDRNEHIHKITTSIWHDSVSSICWFSYLLKADNFLPTVNFVQSYAEFLMLQLWDMGIDAELCECDWGLEFSSHIDSIFESMDKVISCVITSIKPMEWFYSDEKIWSCSNVYYNLKQMLPKLKEEASRGRWPDVKPGNFVLERDKRQAFITLRYSDERIYNLAFKLGMQEDGFDEDMSGNWYECCYDFVCVSSEKEIADYYTEEQKQLCKIASSILDMISFKMLLFYGEDNQHFGIIVERDWAFDKFCLMLDA